MHAFSFIHAPDTFCISFTQIALSIENAAKKIRKIEIVFSTVGNPEIFV